MEPAQALGGNAESPKARYKTRSSSEGGRVVCLVDRSPPHARTAQAAFSVASDDSRPCLEISDNELEVAADQEIPQEQFPDTCVHEQQSFKEQVPEAHVPQEQVPEPQVPEMKNFKEQVQEPRVPEAKLPQAPCPQAPTS